jgi:phage terminase small subunit
MAKSNPNKANQYQLDPRQKLCWDSYINPHSKTFGNAYQSALKAGYEKGTAEQITGFNWFIEKTRRLNMLNKAEKVLEEMLELNTINTVEKGDDLIVKTDPALTKIKQDTAKFVAERLGKENYSSRSELTGKDGEALVITPEEKSKINNIIEEYLNDEKQQ